VNAPAPTHRPPRTDHHHDAVPIETAFDFLNTLELDDGAPETGLVDRLTSLETAARWLTDHEVISDPRWVTRLGRTPSARAATLDRLVSTRTALRDVAHAVAHGDAPADAALAEVNRALAARETVQLVAARDGVRLGHSHHGDMVDDVLARIAEPIARQIGEGREDRFRICANDTCQWIFFDESRPGNRRWCDMATCGNQAKARRHRARRNAPEAASVGPS
jgi:predicted RNA-binding Zn ribbon-like protein